MHLLITVAKNISVDRFVLRVPKSLNHEGGTLIPNFVVWIVTGRCMLNCLHCYASMYRKERELSTSEILRILNDLANHGVPHVHFTGGDPVLRPDIVEILMYARDLGLEVSVFTSCIHIPREFLRTIQKLEIAVYTSCDGYSKETFELIRGSRTRDRFLSNYAILREYVPYIHVNATVCELNWSYIHRVIEFVALRLEPSSLSVIPAMKCGNAASNRIAVNREHYVDALRKVDEKARELGIEVVAWCTPFVPALKLSNVKGYRCRGSFVLDVTPSGNTVLCDIIGIPFANILEGLDTVVKKLLAHPMYREITSIPRKCLSCPYVELCGGGCFARAYIEYGRADEIDPLCPRVA